METKRRVGTGTEKRVGIGTETEKRVGTGTGTRTEIVIAIGVIERGVREGSGAGMWLMMIIATVVEIVTG